MKTSFNTKTLIGNDAQKNTIVYRHHRMFWPMYASGWPVVTIPGVAAPYRGLLRPYWPGEASLGGLGQTLCSYCDPAAYRCTPPDAAKRAVCISQSWFKSWQNHYSSLQMYFTNLCFHWDYQFVRTEIAAVTARAELQPSGGLELRQNDFQYFNWYCHHHHSTIGYRTVS